ncbi:CSMD3 [Branchiostoma lanceolatum]|uniref:CSMD3 protein n=1 Tax=Branchiostoma lanceolatum TaxID=7740 RepID=A0A8J9ZSC9_BRALA|nr:CSMD3 [Branchiostoma lanceolatum]
MKLTVVLLAALLLLGSSVDGWRRRRRRRSCSRVNCAWDEFQPVGSCSSSCGAKGTQFYTRTVKTQNSCGGSKCSGSTFEVRECVPEVPCRNGGSWTGSSCACAKGYTGSCCETKIVCRPLDPPVHGDVSHPSTGYGAKATYSCKPGFELVGAKMRTCGENGYWEGSSPYCTRGQCPALTFDPNGVLYGGTYTEDVMNVVCNPGNEPNGTITSLTCNADNTWSHAQPFCSAVECPPLPLPPHGASSGGTSYLSTVTFSCDPGYELRGSFSRTCLSDGTWTGIQPDCVLEQCACLEAPLYGSIIYNTDGLSGCDVGCMVSFSCNPGYLLQGSTSRTCQVTQQWTGSQPVCIKAHCPPLDIPANGLKFGGTAFMDQVTFTCNTGYEIVGSSTLTCQNDQTWSGTEPSCVRSQCPESQPPAHGEITGGNSFGDTVTYECEVGYRLVGNPTRSCMATKTWSAPDSTCQLKTCPAVTAPDHGAVTGGNTYGEVVTYFCEIGYDIIGTSTRTCQDSQQWSGNQPYCSKIQCSTLNPPTSGSVSGGHEYGDTVQFSCWTGYTLTGSSNRTCQEDGLWSGAQPTCAENECPELDSPPNGYKTGGNGYDDTVIFYCNSGYQVVGPAPVVTRTCQADKTWTGLQPACTRQECPALLSPANGNVTGNNFYGDVVSFTCDPGYELSGSDTRTCQANQQWDGTQPSCDRVQCPPLTPISDGQMSGNNFFGDRTTFVCNTGYELSGSTSRSCQADRTWSGAQTSCNKKQCPGLSAPLNGNVTGGTYYGNTAYYTCAEGYELTGSVGRTCQASQQWSGREPACQKIECPMLDAPPNGGINGTNYYEDTVVFECNVGYELVGSQRRTCQSSQQWTGVQPYCEKKRCPQLTVPANGAANGGIYYGDTASFSCDPGYELVGSAVRTCQADGQWSGVQPTCDIKQCVPLPAPANGSVSGGHVFGEQVTFSCDLGFDLVGVPIRTCEDNQQWSGVQPSCTKKQCSRLTPPPNGALTGGFSFGEVVTITCDAGYELIGSGTRTCEANGQWTGSPSQCQKKCCSRPAIPYGEYRGTHCFNDTVTFSCDLGHELVGDVALTCTETAQWSNQLPSCQKRCCDSSITVADGSVSLRPDNCYGSIADISCNHGYDLIGNQYVVCDESGMWDGEMPTCQESCCGEPGAIRNGMSSSTGLCFGDVATFTCEAGFLLRGNATLVCDANGSWGPTPFCEPYSLCEQSNLAAPSAGSKICFESPQGTTPVEYCQMHCNAPKVYNRNEDMYECSAETSWLWKIRIYLPAGQQLLTYVDVGGCSAPSNPFAAVTVGGLVINANAPLDMAAIEAEMRRILESLGLCNDPCQIGEITVETTPNARSGPRLRKRSAGIQYQVSVQLRAYADMSLVTPANTVQMEWVRLAGQLSQVASGLQNLVVSGDVMMSVDGSPLTVVDGGFHTSQPNLGCKEGELLKGVECVPCGPGTYHDVFEQACRPCPYATYQDEFGQTDCKLCPNGTTTDKSGAMDVTKCKAFEDCNCGIHPCELTPQGYECTCLPGYLLIADEEEAKCVDIDECQQPDVCPGARCINRPGTFSCQCLPGYEEPNCIDIDECRYAGFCPDNSNCTNTDGNYYCTCHAGYHGDDCLDIDECQNETLNTCRPYEHCVNTEGSYTCMDCSRYEDRCYTLSASTATFAEAEQKCAEEGGVLATVLDRETQLFLMQLVGSRDTWIGLDDRTDEGRFVWSDGTPLGSGYSYWTLGEPNDGGNPTTTQDCVHLWPAAGFRWDDQQCSRSEYYVCEFSAVTRPNTV